MTIPVLGTWCCSQSSMDGETALLLQNGNAARIISCKESLPSLSYKRFLDLWTSAHLFLIRGGSTVP